MKLRLYLYNMEINELNNLVDNLLTEQVEKAIRKENTDMKKDRKFYKLTESQLKGIIQNLVVEDSLPGLKATNDAKKESKKINNANTKEVAGKIKKATEIPGGDKPEFPNAHGKGEKKARKATSEEEKFAEENGNRNNLDLDYDSEPSDEFKKRQKKALEGDSTMGNGVEDGSNAVKTDTGKKIAAHSEKRKKAKEKEPFYKKEAVPVSEEQKKKNKLVNEEIVRLKSLYTYGKKTQ